MQGNDSGSGDLILGGTGGIGTALAFTWSPGTRSGCTPLSAPITGNELARRASVDRHPLGRIGTADEIAGAIDWLLGSETNWITGRVLRVDGGLASVRGRKAR